MIKRADPKQSFAEAKGEDLGIAKGCVVKLASKVSGPRVAVIQKKIEPERVGSGEKPINFN